MCDKHHVYALHLQLLALQTKHNLSTNKHTDAMHAFPIVKRITFN